MIITVVGNTFPAFRFLYLKELGVRETVGQTEYYYKEAVVLFLILFFSLVNMGQGHQKTDSIKMLNVASVVSMR